MPLLRRGPARPGFALGGALVLAAFLLYQRTMVRTILGGDPGEFQIAAHVLGVPHPPGYPLWVLLAHLFVRGIPLGTPLWRISLTSPVYAALAVGLVYAINRRLGVRAWIAAGAAALLAGAPAFWGEAIEPRAYALNALQVALLIWLLLRWQAAAPGRRHYWLGAIGLLIGSIFANHASSATLLPGVGLALVVSAFRTGWTARAWGAALRARLLDAGLLFGGVLLGLAPYLLPVVRFLQGGGPYYWGAPQSWADVLALVLDRDYRYMVFGVPWSHFGSQVAWGVGVLADQYGWPGVLIGLGGWAVLARRQPLVCTALALGWVLSFVTAIMYASATSYFYLIPGHLLWVLVLGQAGEWALTAAARHWARVAPRPARPRRARTVALAALLVVSGGGAVATRYSRLDRSHDTAARDQGEHLLRVLPPNALVFVRWDLSSTLKYYALVEGRRRDLVLKAGNPAEWAGHMHDWLREGRAVYVDDAPAPVRAQFRLTPLGGVDRVDLPP